jgi:hypothetical protein
VKRSFVNYGPCIAVVAGGSAVSAIKGLERKVRVATKSPAVVFKATEMREGAGATVRCAFPAASLRTIVGPFVLLDEFFLDSSRGLPDQGYAERPCEPTRAHPLLPTG